VENKQKWLSPRVISATVPNLPIAEDMTSTSSGESEIASEVISKSITPLNSKEMRKKKRKLVDAYMEAVPSSRRQLTLLTNAVNEIWDNVAKKKGKNRLLIEELYNKELAWLQSKSSKPTTTRNSVFLGKAMDSLKNTLHTRIGLDGRISLSYRSEENLFGLFSRSSSENSL